MCLAIPGKLLEKYEENGLLMGRIDFSGAENKACLTYTPEVEVGQYVLVHAGFALQTLDEEEALATLKELTRLARFMEDEETADGETRPGTEDPA